MRQQVVELLPLVNGWAAAVDLIQCGIRMMHPLHQPFQLAVTYQVVATQIPTFIQWWHGHQLTDRCIWFFVGNCYWKKGFLNRHFCFPVQFLYTVLPSVSLLIALALSQKSHNKCLISRVVCARRPLPVLIGVDLGCGTESSHIHAHTL